MVRFLSDSSRDSGLVRTVGTRALAAAFVNTVVGAGIFAVPAPLAASVGVYAPLAFFACAVAVGAVAICFAEGGSRVPTSGGAYGYVHAAFGPMAAYVAGTLLWFSNALGCGSIAAALGELTASVFPPSLHPAVRAVVVVGSIGGIAILNVGGVSRGARFIGTATLLKVIPLALFVLVGVGSMRGANFTFHEPPDRHGVGRAAILALYACTGIEGPLSASGEVANPSRTIPRALALSTASIAALYVAVQGVAQGILGAALPRSSAPLADAMARVSPLLRVVMLVGAGVSMFGWIGSDIFGTPRVLFAFARDRLLPPLLGHLHPRTHAPHVAIAAYAALTIALALTGTFAELAILSTLTSAALYIAGCAASVILAQNGVAKAGGPLGFRGVNAAAAVGIGAMTLLIALASRAEILGLVGLMTASALAYLVIIRSRLARR